MPIKSRDTRTEWKSDGKLIYRYSGLAGCEKMTKLVDKHHKRHEDYKSKERNNKAHSIFMISSISLETYTHYVNILIFFLRMGSIAGSLE